MKTTIKGLIKQHLIKVCKEKTAIIRERVEVKPKKQFTKKKAEEAAARIKKTLDQTHTDSIMEALAILFDAPELSPKTFLPEVFGVIVLAKNNSNHGYNIYTPSIVTKNPGGSGNRLFHTSGELDTGWQYTIADEPRPATDLEVEQCINSLTEKQWTLILSQSSTNIFAPLVAEAMAAEIEVVDSGNGEAKEMDGEIETNGRRITIAKE